LERVTGIEPAFSAVLVDGVANQAVVDAIRTSSANHAWVEASRCRASSSRWGPPASILATGVAAEGHGRHER